MIFCVCRYEGHKNKEYKIDSCLNHKDTHIISGSEDGLVYVWDLVDVSIITYDSVILKGPVLVQ